MNIIATSTCKTGQIQIHIIALSIPSTEIAHAGNFGKVYKALMRKKQHNVPVAVKVVYSVSPNFQKEITVMTEIIHPNIVRLYGLMNEGTHTIGQWRDIHVPPAVYHEDFKFHACA